MSVEINGVSYDARWEFSEMQEGSPNEPAYIIVYFSKPKEFPHGDTVNIKTEVFTGKYEFAGTDGYSWAFRPVSAQQLTVDNNQEGSL